MKPKIKIMAFALTASLMMPTALAYAVDNERSEILDSKMVSTEISPNSAGNASDTTYSFTFNANGATQGTSGRAKEDKTKSYICISTKTVDSCRVYIDGSKKQSGSRWVNETCYKNKTTVGGYCLVNKTGKFSIQNRVRQNGYYYARLTGWGNSLKGKLAGVWSPDSTKSYTVLNHA